MSAYLINHLRLPGGIPLEFPGMAEARNWYESPEYQKILPLRVNNAISDLIFVDGVGPGFTVAGFAQQIRSAIVASGAES